MRLTRETDYAIRMVDYLARSKKIVGAAKIAEETKVPLRFAKNILQKLNKYKIVISHQGVCGGYSIGKEKEISLYDIMAATDSYLISDCFAGDQESYATSENGAPYYEIILELSSDLEKRLHGIKFSAVINGI